VAKLAHSSRLRRASRIIAGVLFLVLTPDQLLSKLATLVPPPRTHGIRYHGLFAPNSSARRRVVPTAAPPAGLAEPAAEVGRKAGSGGEPRSKVEIARTCRVPGPSCSGSFSPPTCSPARNASSTRLTATTSWTARPGRARSARLPMCAGPYRHPTGRGAAA